MTTPRKPIKRVFVVTVVVLVVASSAGAGTVVGITAASTASNTDLSVSMTADQSSINPGESISISVTISNSGSSHSPAPVYALESLPEGWSIATWSASNATYRSSTNEWLWTKLDAGETATLSVTFDTSSDASSTTIAGTLTDGADRTVNDQVNIVISEEQSEEPSQPDDSENEPPATGGSDQPPNSDSNPSSTDPANPGQTENTSDGPVEAKEVANVSTVHDDVGVPSGIEPRYAEKAELATNSSESVTVNFSRKAPISRITFQNQTEGSITVVEPSSMNSVNLSNPGSPESLFWLEGTDKVSNTSAVLETQVNLDEIQARDADAEDIKILHYTNGAWKRLNTSIINKTSSTMTVQAEASGFSPFAVTAIGSPTARITGTDPVVVGEEFTLNASRSTTPYGNITTYQWMINGETYTGKTVTVSLASVGTYNISLVVENGGNVTGDASRTISVETGNQTSQTETQTTTTPTTTPGASTTGQSEPTVDGTSSSTTVPGFNGIQAVLALIVAGAIGLRKHKYSK